MSAKAPPQSTADLKQASAALALLSLIWGYNWVAMKLGLRFASPYDFGAIRFAVGALSLIPVVLYLRRGLSVPRREWRVAAVLAVSLAANFAFTLSALRLGGVGKTAVLVYTMPFWVIVLARVWLKERMRTLQWIAVGLAMIGLMVLVDIRRLHGEFLASAMAVTAGLFWAVTVVMIKGMQGKMQTHLLTFTVWQMAIAALLLWLCAYWMDTPQVQWTWVFVLAVAFSAVLASSLAWMLFYFALARLPAGLAGLGTLATPVIAVAVAWIHFGERPSTQDAIGMVLIGVGLALLSLPGLGARPRRVKGAAQ